MSILKKVADFLGLGRMPETLKKELQAEGFLFLGEGIPATAIFRSYKAFGVYLNYRKITFIGFVAVSERRFLAQAKAYHQIDIAIRYDDPKFKAIAFSATKKHLVLDYDVAAFQSEASDRVTVRLRLEEPESVLMLLKTKGANTAPAD